MHTAVTIASIVAGVPIGIYALKSLSLVAFQNKVIYINYFPPGSRQLESHPQAAFGATYQDVWIDTKDKEKLHAWWIPQSKAVNEGTTIVYFQGNAGNVSHRLELFKQLHQQVGVSLFAPSYRVCLGYGLSTGRPSEKGLKLDAEAIVDTIQRMQVQQLIGKQIVFYGHSLGGAVATYAASLRPGFASGLVLENTFSSIPDMVDEFYPSWTPYRYMKPLLWNHWDTFSLLTAKEGPLSNMPMLFISGEHDEIVPAAMMRKIFDRCVSPEKSWLTVPRGLHNDTWHKGGALHVNALRSFVAAVQTRSSTSS